MAMEITEVRIFPKEGQDKKLKAYATVTFNNVFVVRNIKVIQGGNSLFIAMPSRKMKYPCAKCGAKYEAGNNYCHQCGANLQGKKEPQQVVDAKSEHRDIAHPITQQFRDYLQSKILEEYEKHKNDSSNSQNLSQGVSGDILFGGNV